MVLIARAMAQNAKIIIMDEPCSSLDYGNGIRVMKLCKSLVEEGYLIVQSTHSPEHVFMYADEVMVLQDGKVSVMGTPSEVLCEDILKAVYDINLKLYSIQNIDHQICIPN